MAKHQVNVGVRTKGATLTKGGGVSFKKVSTSDRTRVPNPQAPTKRRTATGF